jgi:hypothetical protein
MGKISCLPPSGLPGHRTGPCRVASGGIQPIGHGFRLCPQDSLCTGHLSSSRRAMPRRAEPRLSLPPWKPVRIGSLTIRFLQEWHLANTNKAGSIARRIAAARYRGGESSISNLFSKALSVVNRCDWFGRASGRAGHVWVHKESSVTRFGSWRVEFRQRQRTEERVVIATEIFLFCGRGFL